MAAKWAKVFDIGDEQILFWYEVSQSKPHHFDIHQLVSHGGERVDIMLMNIPESGIQQEFDRLDEAYAKIALRTIHDIVDSYDKRKSA